MIDYDTDAVDGLMLENHARALLAQRYRGIYLHDLRGGLHAMQSAIEVLVRAATTSRDKTALADRTVELARRAVASHGNVIEATVDRLIPSAKDRPPGAPVGIVRDTLHFLHVEFSSRDIAVDFAPGEDFLVPAPASRLGLIVLGMLSDVLDESAQGGQLHISVHRSDGWGIIDVTVTPRAERAATDMQGHSNSTSGQFTPSVARRLAAMDGGQVDARSSATGESRRRLRYPISRSKDAR